MAEAKKKYPKFTSCRLTFKFPKLSEIDYGTKEYPKPDGEYSTRGVVSADDPSVKAMLAKLAPLHAEAVAAAEQEAKAMKVEQRKALEKKNGKGLIQVNDLFTTLYDQETEEPTGEIEFKFAMKAGGIVKKGPKTGQKWSRKPDLYDAKGQLLKKAPAIWGGTIGKVSFEVSPYFIPGTGAAGLKLGLLGVQIIDLVSGGQRTAASHGFGEEDGYSHEGSFDDETPEGGEEDSSGDEGSSTLDDTDDVDF